MFVFSFEFNLHKHREGFVIQRQNNRQKIVKGRALVAVKEIRPEF